MPSELIEFIFFVAFLILTLSTFALIGWVINKVSSMRNKGVHPYIISDDRRFIR